MRQEKMHFEAGIKNVLYHGNMKLNYSAAK